MSDDIIISVENVGKKYCRSFQRTLFYGVQDVVKDAIGISQASSELRQDEFWALKDISFEVKRSECVGLIGANGVGKSTLLKLLNGIILPDKGTIRVNGRVGALLELGAGFHPLLTGRENIYLTCAVLGMSKRDIGKKFDEIVAFAEMGKFLDSPVKFYSSGMYARLGFAVAIHANLDVLLIDEALAVGDSAFQHRCLSKIRELKNERTILLVSHDARPIVNLCESAIWLKAGQIEQMGSPKLVSEQYLSYAYAKNNNGFIRKRNKETLPERTERESQLNQNIYVPENLANPCHRRFGNGDAQISGMEIVDSEFNRINTLWADCTITAAIRVTSMRELKRPIVGIEVRDKLGNMVLATNTDYEGICLPSLHPGESLTVNLFFTWPFAASGTYSFSPGIADGIQDQHVMCDWIHDAVVLESKSEMMVMGLIKMNCEKILYGPL
jgi:lipopolysaccharide transport system ATP-binding protein